MTNAEATHESAGRRNARSPRGCLAVRVSEDILPPYRGTPIEDLLACHNLGVPLQPSARPTLLIGMCMDYRLLLRVPHNFAYVLRAGGCDIRSLEFHISVAVALGGVTALCLIGHDQCAMAKVAHRQSAFVSGLVENGGWSARDAQNHFADHAPRAAVPDAVGFMRSEAVRLGQRYPHIAVAPLYYTVEDQVLYQIQMGRPS